MNIRVVAIDDSPIALARLEQIVEASHDLRMVRKIGSLAGIDLPRELAAGDVVIVDMVLPGKSGLSSLEAIAAQRPAIAISDAPGSSKLAQEALARGAKAYVSKQELGTSAGEELLRKTIRRVFTTRRAPTTPDTPVILFVGSTGAHRALQILLPELADSRCAAMILQHLPPEGDAHFTQWVGTLGLPARLAKSGDSLEAGGCLVAPSGMQALLDGAGRVRLRAPAPGDLHAPSADVLLSSAAALGSRLMAIVLSGMGRDGSLGVGDVVKAKGVCYAQAPEECVVASMPEAACAASPLVRPRSVADLARELRRAGR